MLRTKPASRRRFRYRTLRLEPLEQRALLSLTTGKASPPTITLTVANTIADCWDFEGQVTCKGSPVANLTVQFGGVIGKYNLTATTDSSGDYCVTEELPDLTAGTATAQTSNAAGKSNVATDFVDSQNFGAQSASASVVIDSIVQTSGVGDSAAMAAATITTVAGMSRYLGDGQAAINASLNSPEGVAVDSLGDVYIADTCNNVVREINAFTGDITTVAGDGVCGYAGDGAAATAAELDAPTGVAVDNAGDIFIADTGNSVVREVVHCSGKIVTVAGDGTCGFSGDGAAATAAELDCPNSVAVNGAGTELFIADSGNNVVREVNLNLATPVIYTVAGDYSLGGGYSGDGYAATSAQLSYPMGVAVADNGLLYIADTGNNVVREVDLNLPLPVISTIAGDYALGTGYGGDGYAATSAQLDAPMGVAVDDGDDLFIADSGNNVVREVDPTTQDINTVAGNGNWGYSGNGGPPTSTDLSDPMSVAVDAAGDLFIADSLHNAVREVNASTDQIETVAGNGTGNYGGDNAAAIAAELYDPTAVAADNMGNIYVADSANNVVRRVDLSTGVITTVAGNGTWGYGGDGYAATAAELNDPMGIAVDAAGNIYIADSGNNVVRKVGPSGTITTIAGDFTLGPGYSGDGQAATSAQLDDPTGLALDGQYLFIADTGNNVIRRVDLSTGTITTVAGDFALGAGYSGDGHAATSAQLNGPTGVAVDAEGNLYIADTANNLVRKVDPGGTISTFAGDYDLGAGYSGDGYAATAGQLNAPNAVAVDAAGNVFIADGGNNVIRRVEPTGTISTFAGNYGLGPGYAGDGGTATGAQLYDPAGIAVDSSGNLFVADSVNNVIREIAPPLYWDPNQTATENAGGSGAWTPGYPTTGGAKCWFDPYLGMDVASGNVYTAIFAGTGGTVTLYGTASPSALVFTSDNYDIVAAAAGDGLVLPPSGMSVNVAADQAEIDGPITGTSTLLVNGPGVFVLGGGNCGTWGTDLESGTVQLALGATLGSGNLTANGGELDTGGNDITVAALAGSGGVITNNCTSSASTLTVTQDTDSAFSGEIQDGAGVLSVVMAGPGVLVLPNDNTFSGGLGVTAGVVDLSDAAAVPDGTSLTVGTDAIAIFGPPTVAPPDNEAPLGSLGGGGPTDMLHDPLGMTSPPGTGATPPPADSPPTVAAIQCVGQPLVDADTVAFSVTFSQPVTGVTASNFVVSGGASAQWVGATVTSVSGSGSQYTVTVGGISPNRSGPLGLNVVNADTITDWYGTALADATIGIDQQFTICRQLYLDVSDTPGGTSTWGAGIADWHVGGPSGPLQSWVDYSDAFFTGGPETVDITSPVMVAAMSFLSSGYFVEGNTITLSSLSSQTPAGSVITVATGSVTIDSRLLGGAMTKLGSGTLALGAANAYSSTVVAAGLLQILCGPALPPGSSLQVAGGIADLGGNTVSLSTVTLGAPAGASGSIVDGTLQAASLIQVYSGTMLANLSGTAALEKLGTGTVALAGQDSYHGGTNAAAGTLVAVSLSALPGGTATGIGTVLVQPTLYWSGSGDWTTGTWQFANGTPTPWIDGANVVLAAGSSLTNSGTVNVGSITATGDVSITGGAFVLPSWGATITILAGTTTIDSAVAGGGLAKLGAGTLVLGGTLGYAAGTGQDGWSTLAVAGVLDILSPLAAAPTIAGGQTEGPGAVFAADGTSLYTLDPAMFDLVQSLFVAGPINRADMIQILDSAVAGGAVTPEALDALQALTAPQNEASLEMPDYVAVLASDVVDGNPANAFYQGQPLGDLANQPTDQARGTALEDLVGKWFYGTDLPAAGNDATYCVVAGSLFGDNPNTALDVPSSADMRQGAVGDCYFIAALGALADSSPSAIEDMFIDNGDGTYTVRFYYDTPQGYTADYVTVNDLLPGYSPTDPEYAQPGANGSWWIPLLEKAYAQWNETGNEGRNGRNSYASLSGGWMDTVDEQAVGTAATDYSPSGTPGAEQAVIAAIQNGAAVTAAIFTDGSAQFNALKLVSGHAYQVVSYDADPQSANYGTFQLANPWGYYEPQPLTWSELTEFCPGIAVAGAAQPVTAASRPTGSAASSAFPEAAGTARNEWSAAILQAVSVAPARGLRYAPEAAILLDFAGNQNPSGDYPTRDARIQALDLLFAQYGAV